MKTSTLIWIGVLLIIVSVGWYVYDMMPAQPAVSPSTDVGLNGSQNQTNTGETTTAPSSTAPIYTAPTNTVPNNTGQTDTPAILAVGTSPTLGTYLVASNGMTLYMFTKDTPNVSTCYDTCALNWPAYSPQGSEPVVPGDGVIGKLSSIGRTGGATQLTYNGMPLYFWHNDVKAGDTLGQNVGGVWFVVKP